MGSGGGTDGEKSYYGKRKDGISEIYGRKIKFVTNVTNVTFQNVIV